MVNSVNDVCVCDTMLLYTDPNPLETDTKNGNPPKISRRMRKIHKNVVDHQRLPGRSKDILEEVQANPKKCCLCIVSGTSCTNLQDDVTENPEKVVLYFISLRILASLRAAGVVFSRCLWISTNALNME